MRPETRDHPALGGDGGGGGPGTDTAADEQAHHSDEDDDQVDALDRALTERGAQGTSHRGQAGKGHFDRASAKYQGRAPRRKDVLQALDFHVTKGDKFESKWEFEMAVREDNEVRGKLVKTGGRHKGSYAMRNNKKILAFRCGYSDDCDYYACGKEQAEGWACTEVIWHSPTCPEFNPTDEEDVARLHKLFGQGKSKSNYQLSHLVPIVKEAIEVNMRSKAGITTTKRKLIDIPTQTIRAAVNPVTFFPIDDRMAQHLKLKCIDKLMGDEQEHTAVFPALIKVCQEKGYNVVHRTTRQESQKQIYETRAQVEFEQEQRLLHPNHPQARRAWDLEKVKFPLALTSAEYKDSAFFHSWMLLWSPGIAMLNANLLRRVLYKDGAHALADQTQVAICSKDANDNVVLLAVNRNNDGENAATVGLLDQALAQATPVIDSADFTVVAEPELGNLKSVTENLPKAAFHCDANRGGDDISAACTVDMKDKYKTWVRATTEERANMIAATFDGDLSAWIDDRRHKHEFPTAKVSLSLLEASRELTGDPTSTAAVSFNKMAINSRLADGAHSLLVMVNEEASRYNKIRRDCAAWHAFRKRLTPHWTKKALQLANSVAEATKVTTLDQDQGLYQLEIPSPGSPEPISNVVCIGAPGFVNDSEPGDSVVLACPCGVYETTSQPCVCMAAAQKARKEPVENLYPACFTSERWDAQYKVHGALELIRKAEIEAAMASLSDEERELGKMLPSVIAPRPVGRPKESERGDHSKTRVSRPRKRLKKKSDGQLPEAPPSSHPDEPAHEKDDERNKNARTPQDGGTEDEASLVDIEEYTPDGGPQEAPRRNKDASSKEMQNQADDTNEPSRDKSTPEAVPEWFPTTLEQRSAAAESLRSSVNQLVDGRLEIVHVYATDVDPAHTAQPVDFDRGALVRLDDGAGITLTNGSASETFTLEDGEPGSIFTEIALGFILPAHAPKRKPRRSETRTEQPLSKRPRARKV